MKKIIFLFFAILFIGLGAAATWSVVNYQNRQVSQNGDDEREPGFLKTSGEFKTKLAELKIKRDKADLQVERLETRKQDAANKLKAKGIRNVGDVVDDDREARLLVAELQDIVKKQDKLKVDIKIYNDAIVSIEAILREFDRELVMTGAGISEQQLEELRRIVYDVEDKLTGDQTALEEFQTQDLLDDILGENTDESQDAAKDKN